MRVLRIVLTWFFIVIFLMSFMSSVKEALAMTATESINKFAFNVAEKLRDDFDSDEYFFSPYSVLSAFGMAYAGAEGNTAREIEEVLGFSPDTHSELGNYIKDIEAEKVFSSANRVWLRNGLKLKEAYKEILLLNYGSTAKELDFKGDNDNSRKLINQWVSDKTNEKIPELLQDLDKDTQMILTNAVYFNAGWAAKFSKAQTSKEKFFSRPDEPVLVDMMKQRGDFLYAEHDGNKIISLPYEGGRFSMIVILPAENNEDFELDEEIFQSWLSSMREYEVDLWLPKFKAEGRYELKDLFEALGLEHVFSNSADFSGITEEESLKINSVVHQTFIDVDEEKTEAAAATALIMVKTTAMPPVEKLRAEFHAQRPFLYFVVDDYTKTILFAGRAASFK